MKVTVDGAGEITAAHLATTSGHDILGRASLDTIRSIEKYPTAPQGAVWSKKTFKWPI